MNKLSFVLLLSFLILFGCSDEPTATEPEPVTENVGKKHMLSDQEKMIQKAKDAEKLIKEADEKRRKALDDQG
jgi:hypothetical protein